MSFLLNRREPIVQLSHDKLRGVVMMTPWLALVTVSFCASADNSAQAASQIAPWPWIPAISAICGALIGGVAAITGTLIAEAARRRADARTLRAALAAEVKGTLKRIEQRKFLASIEQAIALLRNSQLPTLSFAVQVQDPVGPVYEAHLNKLGLLPPTEAALIVDFHQLIESLAQDVRPGGVMAQGAHLLLFEQDLELLREAIKVGEQFLEQCSPTLSVRNLREQKVDP